MKKIVSAVISVAILLSVTLGLNLTVYADELTSGQCGESVYYSYNSDTKTLNIYGEGDCICYEYTLTTYTDEYDNPYKIYHSIFSSLDIQNVIIEEGVTTVSQYAFKGCNRLETISVPKSMISFGSDAFVGCSNLIKTVYRGTINDWVSIQFKSTRDEGDIWCASNPTIFSKNLYLNDNLVTDVEISGVKK